MANPTGNSHVPEGPPPGSGGNDRPKARDPRPLPFSYGWPILAGALAGIALRLIYSGKPGDPYAAMMGSFIYLAPVVVGVVTVYVAETKARRDWVYYFVAPVVANTLFVVGTLLTLIEGIICAVIIIPLFCLLGGISGLVMGAICRATNWPKRTVYAIAALPLVLGSPETSLPLPQREAAVERSTLINAQPAEIWRQIHFARDIRPEEINSAWLYRIGVPVPVAGVTEETPGGLVRRVTMAKNVRFDQVLAEREENRYVRWTYRFDKDSFPPYALDEHVVLGGHYFDIKDTSYTLTPLGNLTELKVVMRYRVSTQFNWYAEPVARFLLGNLEEINLEYYRRRSESRTQGVK